MKLTASLTLILALSASSFAIAESGAMKGMDMKSMDMKDMDMKKCEGMKEMGAEHCSTMMKGMHSKQQSGAVTSHATDGTVKAADPKKGAVTLSHGPVASLGWPAMTMGFSVKDKGLFKKLVTGNKVHVEFQKQGSDYVITTVK